MILMTGVTGPQCCEMCGEKKELRPYGPNGENVCFECGMKDEAAMKRAFAKRFEQDTVSVEKLADIITGKGHDA